MFLSYTRSSDEARHVRALVKEMRSAFKERTGEDLRIFFDVSEIRTADIWKQRLIRALESSSVLVAVIGSSYYRSEWCRREWDYFTALERDPSARSDVRRIFPVLLAGRAEISDGRAVTKRWINDVSSRQYVDLAGEFPSDRRRVVGRLMRDIAASLRKLPETRAVSRAAPIEHLDAVTGSLADRERFVGLLAEAVKVTVVGQTNEALGEILQEALGRKRDSTGNAEAFWSSLRIVFLSENLLDSINDQRAKVPIRAEAVEKRRWAALQGRRSVRLVLGRISMSGWSLYESPYYPPFVGALFEMPNRAKIVQLLMRRPQRAPDEQIYVEFEDRTDDYFAEAFNEIVDFSTRDLGIIPVGMPHEDGAFRCASWRYRHNVLREAEQEPELSRWLPVVLAVTWGVRNGEPVPLLQLRTEGNSHRELDRVSHLSRYIYDRDIYPPDTPLERLGIDFDLPPEVPTAAILSRMEDAHIRLADPPKQVLTRRYLSSRLENLFFYVFTAQCPAHIQPSAEDIRPFTVERLLAIRTSQALRNALKLCEMPSELHLSADAVDLAAANLAVHGEAELAGEFQEAGHAGALSDRVRDRLAARVRQSRQYLLTGNRQVEVLGLAGLQYREFFTMLLPLYREIGIQGADEALSSVEADENARSALERLRASYVDPSVMESVPEEV